MLYSWVYFLVLNNFDCGCNSLKFVNKSDLVAHLNSVANLNLVLLHMNTKHHDGKPIFDFVILNIIENNHDLNKKCKLNLFNLTENIWFYKFL